MAYTSSTSATSQNFQDHSHDNNEPLEIYLKCMQTMLVKVKKDEPLKILKQIGFRGGVSESVQEIFHGDQYLEDELTLEYYGIGRHSAITVDLNTVSDAARKILIRIPSSNNIVEVHARDDDTVHVVKLIIVAKAGLESDRFDLMSLNGRILKNSQQTLSSLNLPKESQMYLVPYPEDTMVIRVRTISRGIFPIEVRKLQTIGDLKLILTSIARLEAEGAKLYFAGKSLKCDKTIISYNIGANNMVELETTYPIYVLEFDGKVNNIRVYPSDCAQQVIAKVCGEAKCTCKHHVYFNEIRLDDGVPIADYNINRGSTLRMSELLNGDN